MVGPQNGGSLDRVHIEAGVPVLSHFFHDLVPYLDCCLLSDNCAKYFKKRPSDDGSNYEPPRPGNEDTWLKKRTSTLTRKTPVWNANLQVAKKAGRQA